MLNRRSLLVAAAGLALHQGLLGCQATDANALQIRILEGSIPSQLLQEFKRRIEAGKVDFLADKQLSDLFVQLQNWKNPPAVSPSRFNLPLRAAKSVPVADWLTLGDYWLTAAIQQNLIQPLSLKQVAGWEQVAPQWRQLVQRDRQGQLSETGEFWAAPYRWGSLVIAYNIKHCEQAGWLPTDWQDLWRSELQGHLSLPDNARSVIGLTLKKMGQSANESNLSRLPTLPSELQTLHRQVKFYSSDAYLQPLLIGDTWATVGWSTEVLPLMKRDRRIAAVVPASGTLLTSDLWVHPAVDSAHQQPDSADLNRWLEFCWQPTVAAQLSTLTSAASPVLAASDRSQLPTALRENALLLPPADVLSRSEFLLPLANDEYRRQWVTMRRTG